MKKILLPLAGLALVAAPLAAQSYPAVAPVSGENKLGADNGNAGIIAAVLAAGVVAIGVLAFTGNDDDDFVSA